MLALVASPIGRLLMGGVAVLAVVAGIYFTGVRNGSARVQARFDAYKVEIQQQIEAEKARQKAEFAEAIALLQEQLAHEQAESDEAWTVAERLEASIAARPEVPGRGATQEDVDALNR